MYAGPVPIPQLVGLAVEVLEGLAELHAPKHLASGFEAGNHPVGLLQLRLPVTLWHLMCAAHSGGLYSSDQHLWRPVQF